MTLKTYDGWTAVQNENGGQAVLAKFTKDDDSVVYYNFAALKRKSRNKSEKLSPSEQTLISQAISEGPKFFNAYTGWRDIGHGRTVMVCTFTRASGEKVKRGLAALMNMAANPPPKFSPYDKAILNMAIQDAPAPNR